jgi:hypothetical protein
LVFDSAMNDSAPAREQGGDCTDAHAFLQVQPGGLGPLMGA